MNRGIWAVVGFWMLLGAASAQSPGYFEPVDAPMAVKHEKAQMLLRLWGFVSQDFMTTFRLNSPQDADRVREAYERLSAEDNDSAKTSGTLAPGTERFLVTMLVRNRMISSLDFSEESLRHFFSINSKRYSCEAMAKVGELLIPKAYLDDLGSTEILTEIGGRLQKEDFARVSYDVTGRFGKAETGLIGDVTSGQAGEERFALYRRANDNGGVAGPFEVTEGMLFVKIYDFNDGGKDCFENLKETVARDFGREWLKKITNDTLTTIARELKPQVVEITTVPLSTDTAFTIKGRVTTFGEARQMMSFLFGNEQTVEFWKSIQRQALESELVYQGEQGQQVRESGEYRKMAGVLGKIADAQGEISKRLSSPPDRDEVERWFENHKQKFVETGKLTYELYECEGQKAELTVCGAMLEKLDDGGETTGSLKGVEMTNVEWGRQSREIQAACQELDAGKWSGVFSMDGKPARVFLKEIDRRVPTLDEKYNDVVAAREVEQLVEFWRDFGGLSEPDGETK